MKSKILEKMRGTGMTVVEAEKAFNTTVSSLAAVIDEAGEARVPGLGTFKKKFQAGRAVRNPKTGDMVQTVDRHVIKFKQTSAK